MKKALFVILTVLTIAACKKDSISYSSEFEDSYKTWQSYKQANNNSYSYVVVDGSVLGNTSSKTTINVINGKVNSRSYVYNQYAPNSSAVMVTKSWTENSNQLNTHPNEGAEVQTLDEVYNKAKTVWLAADKKENDIYFETRNNGLISSCGYVPKGCQDDCFTGISISSITAL